MSRRRLRHRTRRDESGFTLAELIISIAIETIVFGALATAFVVVLNGGSTVGESLKKSSDARFAATYIVSDARNSSGPDTSLVDVASCPDPNPPVVGTQTPVVRFNWTTATLAGGATPSISVYGLVDGSLLRRHCEGGVLINDAVLAADVATVAVVCAPIADCTGTPTAITVTITETPDTNGGVPYTYSLTAAFRKLVGGGAPLVAPVPESLVIFGSGGCGVNVQGAGVMKVYGKAVINTADSPGCRALTLGNSGVFTAGSTSILNGGTCSATGGSLCPTPITTYSPAVADPYGGVIAPTTTGRPAQAGCPSGKAQPGVYAANLTFGSSPCELQSGIYILQNGFNLGNGAVVTTAAGGVLIYMTGGAFLVNGGASLTLTAATTGAYSGMSLWQAAADTSTISFSNGGALIFYGSIYAPTAELNISGNAQTPIAKSIVVQTVVITNSGGVKVGASPVALSITAPASLPSWTINKAYPSTTMTPAGGDGDYSWSATGLPTGLSIDVDTGVISGTPTAVVASASVVVKLDDALGDDADTAAYTFSINAVPTISTVSLPGGEQTLAYSATVSGSGGTAPYIWAAAPLPAGVSFNQTTGAFSGTPTTVGTTATIVTLTDAAGATLTKSLSIIVAAQPLISSVSLVNGGTTSGTIDAGDKVSIVFSAQMKVSSFCSTWTTADTTDQVLNGLSDVTVSVSNGTTDALTVTSATCTFNFGSINLASSAYVTAAATFKGSTTGTRSTIAWTASTRTLLVTLGARTAGTVANVTALTSPIYTVSPTVKDSQGAVVGNSPFTVSPAAKRF